MLADTKTEDNETLLGAMKRLERLERMLEEEVRRRKVFEVELRAAMLLVVGVIERDHRMGKYKPAD